MEGMIISLFKTWTFIGFILMLIGLRHALKINEYPTNAESILLFIIGGPIMIIYYLLVNFYRLIKIE
jgi:uncharacterized membrane protein YidH (DUF202 family)